jgi:competence protein ComEC
VADQGRRGRAENRASAGARTGARTGTTTWPVGRARGAGQWAWPQAEFAIPARLREWALIDFGAGRLLPWFAVAFGFGIVLYFTPEHEPAWWAAAALAAVALLAAILLRRRAIAFVVALGILAIAAGFATATVKTALIAHPLLRYPGIMAQVPQASGWLELARGGLMSSGGA